MRSITAFSAAALAASALLSATPALAEIVVLDFENHPGDDVLLENGYGGITWGGAFRTYDTAGTTPETVFNPKSGTTAAYFNYTDGGMTSGTLYTRSMIFDAPVLFLGAWFSGDEVYGVAFDFYLDGEFLGTTYTPTNATPAFLSGIGKAVNEVRVRGGAGNFIMDDVSWDTEIPVAGAIPEPGTWALMILGFGAMGAMLRQRRGVLT